MTHYERLGHIEKSYVRLVPNLDLIPNARYYDTLNRLAKESGLDSKAISRWFRQQQKLTVAHARLVARALKLNILDIIEHQDTNDFNIYLGRVDPRKAKK